MKRLLPWLMGVGLLGAGCSPKSDVAPGAPKLTMMTIVESGGITDIKGDETDCTAAADGAMCDPMADSLCRSLTSWCRCQPSDPMDMTKPSFWSCLFEPTSMVIATFDRLLDTQPLDYDPDTQPGRTDIATFTTTAGMTPKALVQYVSNGSETGLIFKLLTNVIHGPRLLVAGSPALPSGSSLTLMLDKTKIRAKDHTSLFVGSGLFKDGALTFATAPLSATIDVPMAPPPDAAADDGAATDAADEAGTDATADAGVTSDAGDDAGAATDADEAGTEASSDAGTEASSDAGTEASSDAGTEASSDTTTDTAADGSSVPAPLPTPVMADSSPLTITFNNVTDPDQIKSALTVTVSGQPFTKFTFETSMMNPLAYTLTPTDPWPAGSVIVVTVGATAADVEGVALGASVTAIFVTEP